MNALVHPLTQIALLSGFGVSAILSAQMALPDPSVAIQRAAEHGYESVLIVLIILTIFSLFTWAVRSWISQEAVREERLANRVTSLEDKITDRLLAALDKSSEAIIRNSESLENIHDALEHLSSQMERFGDGVERIEASLKEHDSRVEENIARAAGTKNIG